MKTIHGTEEYNAREVRYSLWGGGLHVKTETQTIIRLYFNGMPQ